MRIISQDGYCDLPYEQTALRVSAKAIYAGSASVENVVMAIYSSKAKAIKAMEMCREQYAQSELNKDMIQKVADTLSKISVSVIDDVRKQLAEKYLFQFPADDEI